MLKVEFISIEYGYTKTVEDVVSIRTELHENGVPWYCCVAQNEDENTYFSCDAWYIFSVTYVEKEENPCDLCESTDCHECMHQAMMRGFSDFALGGVFAETAHELFGDDLMPGVTFEDFTGDDSSGDDSSG